MRYIIIPENVVFDHLPDDPRTKKPQFMSFANLIRHNLVSDAKVTADPAAVDRFLDMGDAVKNLKPGEVWALSDEDHEWLSQLARGFQYNPEIKIYVLVLVRAITSAAKAHPKAEVA